MTFRFIHTADWQIGKVFRFLDDGLMGALQLARLEAITRIGELAGEHRTGHVVVAGDVWDHAAPSPISRNRVLERMREHPSVQWHLMPGNHDPHQANGLWDQLRARGLPDNVHVYTEPAVSLMEVDVAALLPAPLLHRRTLADPTEWMDTVETDGGLIRIGLGHGAVYGFDSDEEQQANPISPERPQRARLDYLALGDWHGELRVSDRCWYSGTPETDSFQTRGEGTALLVEINGPGAMPEVTKLSTGQFHWRSLTGQQSEHISSASDIDSLEQRLRTISNDPTRTLVELSLYGALSLADLQYFEERIVEGAAAALYCLRVEAQLEPDPTDDDLDRIDPGGIVRAAADKLRTKIDGGGEAAQLAGEALRRLYVEYRRLETSGS